MEEYLGTGEYYHDDGLDSSEYEGSSEPTARTIAGAPMTREWSGGSTMSGYSSDVVWTPSPEHEACEPIFSFVPVDDDEPLWSPLSDNAFSPACYDHLPAPDTSHYFANHESTSNISGHDDWWVDYDFIADAGPGQQAYWRLRPGIRPTAKRPATRAAEDISATVQSPPTKTNEGMFLCLKDHCRGSFRRKADLERHYDQCHTPKDKRAKYPCDWKKCQRANDPFHRRDHYRAHLRDYHLEDLMRRGSSGMESQIWWDSRVINPKRWRCARCLTRVKIQEHGYTCPKCGTSCETERQEHRARAADQYSSA